MDLSHQAGSGSLPSTDIYAPSFDYRVKTADGRSYPAQGYDALDISTSDRASQQAILDRSTVGQTYQCWYDPAQPARAILIRSTNWLLFIVAGAFLAVGGVFAMTGGLLLRNFRRQGGNVGTP